MTRLRAKAAAALVLLMAVLGTGCQSDRELLQGQQTDRRLALSASMPQDGASMRVVLEKDEEQNILVARWQKGDKVTFVFEQGAQLTDPVEVETAFISQDGKSATLNIEVPMSIDTAEAYTIHAFCGIPGSGVHVRDKEVLVDILPLRGDYLTGIAVPVFSKLNVEPEEMASGKMVLPFVHLGCVEYVDIKNSSDAELKVFNCHLYPTESGAEEWRYLPGNGKHYVYKPMTDEVVAIEGEKPNPLQALGTGVGVLPGGENTFAVWHRPTGKNIPEFGISIKTDNGVQLSANRKIAKTFFMAPGKAYSVRAEWKDNRLTILGDDVDGDLPFMRMTTKKAVGEKIKLRIDAKMADQADVWIDLNNNTVKDEGESVTVFGYDQEYTLGSQSITVRGKVIELMCIYNKLTSLDVSKNTALEVLNCYGNNLTSLDVSKNTALKELYCGKNLFTSLDVSKNTKLTVFACDYNKDLTSLKIPGSIRDRLHCKECKLSAETLNEIFRTLPDVTGQTEGYKKVWIAGNPGTDACNKKIATDKGWTVSLDRY